MSAIVLVEANSGGHRFQAVRNTATIAPADEEVVLLTSRGASSTVEYAEFLGDVTIKVEERFDGPVPSTREMADAVAQLCLDHDVSTVAIMEADQPLKRWFYEARRAMRAVPRSRRPRFVMFVCRFPTRVSWRDRNGWLRMKLPKSALLLAAMATGTLHHAAGFAGRDDMSVGWLVRRARDPEICTAHHRDRDALRAELGLPLDRPLVGLFGAISWFKEPFRVLDAMELEGLDDAQLVFAGGLDDEVVAWIDGLPPERRARLIVHNEFLPGDVLDKMVAAVDAAPITFAHNAPSGIMGKALAAGVPVVTAGSTVREAELEATGGGVCAELTAESIGRALRLVLEHGPEIMQERKLPPATPEEFGRSLLGVDEQGAVIGRRPRRFRS